MKLKNILLASLMFAGIAHAEAPAASTDAMVTGELRGSVGNTQEQVAGLIKQIGTIGFSTVAANTNIQEFYFQKYKEKNVEMISFFDIVNKEKMRPLLLKNPDFGAFSPFNFLVYKTLDTKTDNNTWYGHLTPDTMLEIIGEKDPASRKEFSDMVAGYDALVTKTLKPTMHKTFTREKALPKIGLTKMVKKFDKPDDLEEWIEEFVGDHDGRFAKHNFIIAGFLDFKFEYDDMDLAFDKYDAYWVSLLCHFKFSNSIFNHGVPEAGMFAPCTIYFYIPKGKNELHVGYSSVNNWVNGLNFKDSERIKYMRSIDAEVVETFKEMGFELVQHSTEN